MGDLNRNFTVKQGDVVTASDFHGFFDGLTIKPGAVTADKLGFQAVNVMKLKVFSLGAYLNQTLGPGEKLVLTLTHEGVSSISPVSVCAHGEWPVVWNAYVPDGGGAVKLVGWNISDSAVTFSGPDALVKAYVILL